MATLCDNNFVIIIILLCLEVMRQGGREGAGARREGSDWSMSRLHGALPSPASLFTRLLLSALRQPRPALSACTAAPRHSAPPRSMNRTMNRTMDSSGDSSRRTVLWTGSLVSRTSPSVLRVCPIPW